MENTMSKKNAYMAKIGYNAISQYGIKSEEYHTFTCFVLATTVVEAAKLAETVDIKKLTNMENDDYWEFVDGSTKVESITHRNDYIPTIN